ncbi:MAG TPA: response regulator [Bryobacteraceae bacterium]|nr:response regulator [Bryobacteraceae bacterium]
MKVILVVDGDGQDRAFAKGVLERAGYRVLDAAGYEQALETYRAYRGKIHLLLTALALPDRNGYELARTLFHGDPDLKALFVSGLTGAEVSPYYHMPLTGAHMLTKPLDPEDLLQRVNRVLRRRRSEFGRGAS